MGIGSVTGPRIPQVPTVDPQAIKELTVIAVAATVAKQTAPAAVAASAKLGVPLSTFDVTA